jgi:hypothetical protein
MNIADADAYAPRTSDTPLGDWYATLFHVQGKLSLLFTNERTGFSFFCVGIGPSDIHALEYLFRYCLIVAMENERFSAEEIMAVHDEYRHITYARAISNNMRRLLAETTKYIAGTLRDHSRFGYRRLQREINHIPILWRPCPDAIAAFRSIVERHYAAAPSARLRLKEIKEDAENYYGISVAKNIPDTYVNWKQHNDGFQTIASGMTNRNAPFSSPLRGED